MKLYGRITTDTGKVVGKGANGSLKLEVLDDKQKTIFSQEFITLERDLQEIAELEQELSKDEEWLSQ
jgi:hypothetical protein